MALNYVTLTVDIYDGTGNIPSAGQVSFAPSVTLTDATDHELIAPLPVVVAFKAGVQQIVKLVATDNGQVLPAGWAWTATFTGTPGLPANFSFFLPFSAGASQFLSSQAPVFAAVTNAPYAAITAYGEQQLLSARAQALTPWTSALANRRFARLNIACVGDSITEGQHATLPPTGLYNRWTARLTDLLRAKYPWNTAGGGGRGFLGTVSTGTGSFTWPATLAGSPPNTAQGPKGTGTQLNTTGQSITYVLTGDSADIMWEQVFGGGTFSWAVDGGSATNVSTNGGSSVDGKLTRISLGNPGIHTLVLAWVSGNSNIDGVIEYYGDSGAGIQCHDCGHFGWSTTTWASALSNGNAGPAGAIAALSPGLVLIELGVNDQFANILPATFQSNLQLIISRITAQLTAPFPAIVLVMLPPRTGQSGYTYPWAQYIQAAWNVAALDTSGPVISGAATSIVSVCDFTLGPRFQGADNDVYGFWQAGDLIHPGDRGHQAIADTLAAYLTMQG